jgi:2'-5' RNA ligase
VAIAINLRADDTTADEIERLWDQVAEFEDVPSMRALACRPHFTFGIYDTAGISEATAWEAMARVVNDETQLRIDFGRIGWFPGSPLVLWAAPTANQVLMRWHASLNAIIDPSYCRPHYRPGAWTPHCTLGTRVTEEASDAAIAFARSFDRTISVLFDVVDCVTFPPVCVFAEQTLPPVSSSD